MPTINVKKKIVTDISDEWEFWHTVFTQCLVAGWDNTVFWAIHTKRDGVRQKDRIARVETSRLSPANVYLRDKWWSEQLETINRRAFRSLSPIILLCIVTETKQQVLTQTDSAEILSLEYLTPPARESGQSHTKRRWGLLSRFWKIKKTLFASTQTVHSQINNLWSLRSFAHINSHAEVLGYARSQVAESGHLQWSSPRNFATLPIYRCHPKQLPNPIDIYQGTFRPDRGAGGITEKAKQHIQNCENSYVRRRTDRKSGPRLT